MSNEKDKAGVVALVVAIFALILTIGFSFFGGSKTIIQNIEPATKLKSGSITGIDSIGYYNGEGTTYDGVVDVYRVAMGSATDTAVLKNFGDATVYLSDANVYLQATSTGSSFRSYLFATATPYVLNSLDYTNLVNTGGANATKLLVKATYATGTAATTTSSVMSTVLGNGEGQIAIPVGWSVVLYTQSADANCVSLPAVGGCLQSTSTSNGLSALSASFKVYSTGTSPILRSPF